jgi:transcription elongation factor Elf1
MSKKSVRVEVDTEKSLYYVTNGRLKKGIAKTTASMATKTFVCPACLEEESGVKLEFGEQKICQKCGSEMLESVPQD